MAGCLGLIVQMYVHHIGVNVALHAVIYVSQLYSHPFSFFLKYDAKLCCMLDPAKLLHAMLCFGSA